MEHYIIKISHDNYIKIDKKQHVLYHLDTGNHGFSKHNFLLNNNNIFSLIQILLNTNDYFHFIILR